MLNKALRRAGHLFLIWQDGGGAAWMQGMASGGAVQLSRPKMLFGPYQAFRTFHGPKHFRTSSPLLSYHESGGGFIESPLNCS